jgi:hypothetical protein
MGEPDRFEIVKSLQRCVKTEYRTHGMRPDCSGSTLTIDEMDAAVKLVESIKAEMAAERLPGNFQVI